MMNSANAKYKMSSIEKGTNKQIILIFVVQILMCLTCAIVGSVWQFNMGYETYLAITKDSTPWERNIFLMTLRMTGTWVLIFT